MLLPSGPPASGSALRLGIRVSGVVQGVGFRPTVFRIADSLGLAGFVRNDGTSVWIEVEGDGAEQFAETLRTQAPAAARIDRVEIVPCAPHGGRGFSIARSADERAETAPGIPPDLAPCEACVAEMLDPAARRYLYPFTHCTSCGPRYALVERLPYDRDRTTMAAFPLCDECRREYEDPYDRRFHAEPVACPRCGPQLRLLHRGQELASGDSALWAAAEAIADGAVVALKGVGGFVLACDAADASAISKLRTRKRRPHKPFAVMCHSLDDVRRIALPSDVALDAMASPARPIVLVPERGRWIARNVAPGLDEIGVFLPPSPLQFLLTKLGPHVQVMTSGNATDEPIAVDDAEAMGSLAQIADLFLTHDRAIAARADDSVARVVGGRPLLLRRARGYVPAAIELPVAQAPVLAVGGDTKDTVCLAWAGRAVLSAHVGDLTHPAGYRAFEQAVRHLVRLAGTEPVAVAHDLHPDYRSTRWAEAQGIRTIAVQHHHAHVASCLADNGVGAPAVGIAFDGTGFGADGTLWGGEILLADFHGYARLGHLRPLRLVGGEWAIREPRRVGLAALLDADEDLGLLGRQGIDWLTQAKVVWAEGSAAPPSTGAGRWFDAVAALLGVRDVATWDGQAACELEALAGAEVAGPYPFRVEHGATFQIDLRPVIRWIASDCREGVPPSTIAARFHETMAHAVLAGARHARSLCGVGLAALTGGCFQNRRFAERAKALLEADAFTVLVHRNVPANDGGLALGQAAIASAHLSDT
jgi:hydrogenase maturation protein HypF